MVQHNINLDSYRLGELFARMDSLEKMRFLNGFATSIDEKWPFQCRSIQEKYDFSNSKAMKRKAFNALIELAKHLGD